MLILPILIVLSPLQFQAAEGTIQSSALLPQGFLTAGTDNSLSLESLDLLDIIWFASGIFAIFLMALTLLSYRNVRATRLLFVAGAFGLFAVQAIVSTLEIYISASFSISVDTGLALASFAILSLFFLAIVKKDKVHT